MRTRALQSSDMFPGRVLHKKAWTYEHMNISKLWHSVVTAWWSVGVPIISALLHGCSWASWKFSGPFTISRHNVEGCAQARSDLMVWWLYAREIKVKRVLQTTALLFASCGSLSRLILAAEGVMFRENSTTLCTSQNISQTQSATSWWTDISLKDQKQSKELLKMLLLGHSNF